MYVPTCLLRTYICTCRLMCKCLANRGTFPSLCCAVFRQWHSPLASLCRASYLSLSLSCVLFFFRQKQTDIQLCGTSVSLTSTTADRSCPRRGNFDPRFLPYKYGQLLACGDIEMSASLYVTPYNGTTDGADAGYTTGVTDLNQFYEV